MEPDLISEQTAMLAGTPVLDSDFVRSGSAGGDDEVEPGNVGPFRTGIFSHLRKFKLRPDDVSNVDAMTEEPDGRGISGLHDVIKGCDVSFGIDASQVERRAVELGSAAAAANLPRLDVKYNEVPEELELSAQCRSVFEGWATRVRTRVQDALQQSTQSLTAELKTFEHELGGLEAAVIELPVRCDELKSAQAAADAGRSRLEYRAYMSKVWYILFMILLVAVDWIANVPVFAQLLPKDADAEEQWRIISADAERFDVLAGAVRTIFRALHHIDASLLALGIIIMLVWLAHALGESARRFITHSEKEEPEAGVTIRSQRRQSWIPMVSSAACLCAVVAVLWVSRDKLGPVAVERVAAIDAKIVAATLKLEAARTTGDIQQFAAQEQSLSDLENQRRHRVDDADYATVISAMNLPILFLNLALAATAALAAYLSTSGRIDGIVVSHRVADLQQRVTDLRSEMARRRIAISRADTEVTQQFARFDYLSSCKPLEGWQAKAQRLEAIIPRFRSENARLRGVDTANIAAFDRPSTIGLQIHDEGVANAATAVAEHRALHTSLQERATAVRFLANELNGRSNGNGSHA